MFGAVVLAAGASSRLGSPKALLSVAGEKAIARVCRLSLEAGSASVVVVLGAEADRLRPEVPPGARTVVNEHWKSGQTSSVQAGVRSLDSAADLLVWPVDTPGVGLETVKAIVKGPGAIRVPVRSGKRGHPTLFSRHLREEILRLGPDEPLHTVVHRDHKRIVEVPVEDDGVLLNVNMPADRARLEAIAGRPARARPSA